MLSVTRAASTPESQQRELLDVGGSSQRHQGELTSLYSQQGELRAVTIDLWSPKSPARSHLSCRRQESVTSSHRFAKTGEKGISA